MELPDIGKHCAVNHCKQYDFLPLNCGYCKHSFCQDHSNPVFISHPRENPPERGHLCAKLPAEKADARAITCPICAQVIPVKRGVDPNNRVNEHIQSGCPNETTSTSSKAYVNACSLPRCGKRELIPIKCSSCSATFCIKHRLEADHKCPSLAQNKPSAQGQHQRSSTSNSNTAAAALRRQQEQQGSRSRQHSAPVKSTGQSGPGSRRGSGKKSDCSVQ